MRPKQTKDVRDLYEGSAYAPLHGWRSDEEVIAALRTLITDALAGTAEDMPEEVYPLPEDVGAAVAIGYDEQGILHPLVWVRTDIPSGLRADLWGYCAALSASLDRVDVEPDENGIFHVRMERSPVTGPGVALLAAVTVQRLGRRPEDCAFPLLTLLLRQRRRHLWPRDNEAAGITHLNPGSHPSRHTATPPDRVSSPDQGAFPVGRVGLEPTTNRLKVCCSDQLS